MLSSLEVMTSEISGIKAPITPEVMSAWQMAQIREAMRRAAEQSAFYAKRLQSVDISSIDCEQAMRRVPFTTQEELTEAPDAFVCVPEKKISRVTSLRTSGSTAAPKRLRFTEADLARTARLFELGMTPIIGGGKRCLVMMSDATPGSIASLLKEGVERTGVPALIYGGITDVDEAAAAVQSGDAIVGVPSQIIRLCRKYPRLRPESLLLSADYVPEPIPDAIRDLWQCRVYTHYGMTETCFGCAVQCGEESAQHIRHDSLLIEIIDPATGEPLPAGSVGEIVVTAFANEATPLFRYRTGDISSLAVGKCECGSLLPRLERVRGRLKNIFEIDGKKLSIEKIDDALYAIPELYGYTAALQTAHGKKVLFLQAESASFAQIKEKIKKTLSVLLPASVTAVIEEQKSPQPLPYKRRMTVG